MGGAERALSASCPRAGLEITVWLSLLGALVLLALWALHKRWHAQPGRGASAVQPLLLAEAVAGAPCCVITITSIATLMLATSAVVNIECGTFHEFVLVTDFTECASRVARSPRALASLASTRARGIARGSPLLSPRRPSLSSRLRSGT